MASTASTAPTLTRLVEPTAAMSNGAGAAMPSRERVYKQLQKLWCHDIMMDAHGVLALLQQLRVASPPALLAIKLIRSIVVHRHRAVSRPIFAPWTSGFAQTT